MRAGTPAPYAAASISPDSAADIAVGFSHSTALPAASAQRHLAVEGGRRGYAHETDVFAFDHLAPV